MSRESVITQESFEALLDWLDPSREAAGRKYETIRARLIRIFVSHGCSDAEDLADLTINRVIARLPDIRDGYVGDPANYFHGVARNVLLESRRKKEIATGTLSAAPGPPPDAPADAVRECLRECLAQLPADQREMVLDYHLDERRAKIDRRRRLTKELDITANALRLRVHRIRAALEKCVLRCLEG